LLGVGAREAESGREHHSGDQQAAFGGQHCAKGRRGDAHEDEGSAPDRREENRRAWSAAFIGRIIAAWRRPR